MKIYSQYGRFRVVKSCKGTYHVQVCPLDPAQDWVSIETFDYLHNARTMAKHLWMVFSGGENYWLRKTEDEC